MTYAESDNRRARCSDSEYGSQFDAKPHDRRRGFQGRVLTLYKRWTGNTATTASDRRFGFPRSEISRYSQYCQRCCRGGYAVGCSNANGSLQWRTGDAPGGRNRGSGNGGWAQETTTACAWRDGINEHGQNGVGKNRR